MDALPGPDVPSASDWTPLVDVSALSISDLVGLLDSQDKSSGAALDRVLRQVLLSLDDPNGVLSAFQSFLAE